LQEVQYNDFNDFFYPRLYQRGKQHVISLFVYSELFSSMECLTRK